MSKIINGKRCYLVDIIYDDYFIYEVYEDEQGNKYKRRIDYRRFWLWQMNHLLISH